MIRHKVREVPRTSQLTRVTRPAKGHAQGPPAAAIHTLAIYWKPAPGWREAQQGRSTPPHAGLHRPQHSGGGLGRKRGVIIGGDRGGGVAMTLVGALRPCDNRHPCESGRREPGQERPESSLIGSHGEKVSRASKT